MTITVQQQATNADTAVTRTDLVRLLQEAGSPEQLDVTGQDLHGITLMNGNLRGANLSLAQVCEANLCGANLSRADLHGANLCGTYLCWANLRGANLSRAQCLATNFQNATLEHATWRNANLEGADLRGHPWLFVMELTTQPGITCKGLRYDRLADEEA